MSSEVVKLTKLSQKWDDMRTAIKLLKEGKGRIVVVKINGKERKYVKPYETDQNVTIKLT